ncbi:hypothetical protein GGR58DRAFT_500843 [Xylaria digitata]|nr:hypothetical protein GGR58DRAFT_500843 [Xylaria digitata]
MSHFKVMIMLTYLKIFGLGESIVVGLPQSRILGKDVDKIMPNELEDGLKYQADYAAELLFQLALGFAKLSVCENFLALSPSRSHRLMIVIVVTTIVGATISSFFGTAFQCGISRPWDYMDLSCINSNSFHIFEGIINVVTDLFLVAISIIIIFPLKMAIKTRLIVIAFYPSRLLLGLSPSPVIQIELY